MFERSWTAMGKAWCRLMHESIQWPAHGRYECRVCGRQYAAFAEQADANWAKHAALRTPSHYALQAKPQGAASGQ
jgi:hypothetical protein